VGAGQTGASSAVPMIMPRTHVFPSGEEGGEGGEEGSNSGEEGSWGRGRAAAAKLAAASRATDRRQAVYGGEGSSVGVEGGYAAGGWAQTAKSRVCWLAALGGWRGS
jgi:hypothetical protein